MSSNITLQLIKQLQEAMSEDINELSLILGSVIEYKGQRRIVSNITEDKIELDNSELIDSSEEYNVLVK